MTKIKIGTGDWIVVCDGHKALILENLGDRMFPNLHTREVHEQPDMSTHAQGSDAPGRVHQSMGGARSSVEQTDWHDEFGAIIPEDSGRAVGRCGHDRRNLGRDGGRLAPRARHDQGRLFGCGSKGSSRRNRQGSDQDAGLRNREAAPGVTPGTGMRVIPPPAVGRIQPDRDGEAHPRSRFALHATADKTSLTLSALGSS